MTNYLPRILVTGGNGQLATALAKHERAKEFSMTLCSHAELDITQSAAIQEALGKYLPDIVINTAAYTAVDKAETETSLADLNNHIGAGLLGLACHKHQIKLFHLSTDYVFDGKTKGEYLEDDITSPINIYGKTKLLGEQAIQNNCPNHVILRVSGVFSEYGSNFLRTIMRLAHERTSLKVVSDQVTCPTYAGDIADALFSMVLAPSHKGIYHFCSKNPTSWHHFAQSIINTAKEFETVTIDEVQAVTTAEYHTDAKRPQHSVLDCSKIAMTYNIQQPNWKNAIKHIIPKLIRERA
jgi:dTDP-4-dehydrorhamnose reductase